MSALYVTGGRQGQGRPVLAHPDRWYEYERGLILRVDPAREQVQTCVDYLSPPEVCAEHDPQILFKSATRRGQTLYACTQTEILLYHLPSFQLERQISLPCFNDLHHVLPTPAGTLLAANSGLDMVLELALDGQVLREWGMLEADPWARFSRALDYRRGLNTKPHRSHPNHLCLIDDGIWATRFQQRDAVCVNKPGLRIELGGERVHDGLLHDGRLYFTTVDGTVVIADPLRQRVEEIVDLAALHEPGTLLGWCRGILVDGSRAWVGFSHIRPTRLRENVAWLARGFRQTRPTHIGLYDLARRRCLAEIDLQRHGLDAVFSILPADEVPACDVSALPS
jgi:hypothetical protein